MQMQHGENQDSEETDANCELRPVNSCSGHHVGSESVKKPGAQSFRVLRCFGELVPHFPEAQGNWPEHTYEKE